MRFNTGEIVNFLEFLEQKFPGEFDSVESLSKNAPPAIDRDNVFPVVHFLYEAQLVAASPIEENGKFVDFKFIRINSNGINYLINLRK